MVPEIHLTQNIDAPESRVWQAVSQARGLMGWQADRVTGSMERGATVSMAWPALGVSLELDVMEVVDRARVVLASGSTRVEISLRPGRVELTHSGVGEGDEREGVASSWRLSLGLLAHFCEAHGDVERTVRWLIRPARTTPETAHVFFTDPVALSTWLGDGAMIGRAGSDYALDLGGGERLSGRVLANTPGRDVALSWSEDNDSALVLRTLPRPTEPEERLIVLSWSRWGGVVPGQRRLELLDAAHHRLSRALDSQSSA
ncbi:MAG: hypothetical protein IPI67_02655 [Myxococcales bacterium]|nr:hypothetical protein [Myxococcales bacterium]